MMNEQTEKNQCTEFQSFWDSVNPASKLDSWNKKGTDGFYRTMALQNGITHANTMFKLLPGTFMPLADLVSVDEDLNTWKGNLLYQGMEDIEEWMEETRSVSEWIGFSNGIAAGFALMEHPEVVVRSQKTHTRLHLVS
jgi:hypothetical protein